MPQENVPLISTKDSRQPYLYNISTGDFAYDYRGPRLKNAIISKSSSGEVTVQPRYGIRNYVGDLGANISTVVQGRLGSTYTDDQLIVVDSNGDLYEYSTNMNSWGTKTPDYGSAAAGSSEVSVVQWDASGVLVKGSQSLRYWDGTVAAPVIDPDYPTYTIPGCVAMDSMVFVATMDGKIYNSAVADHLTWSATDFLTAERRADRAVYLAKHHDNIVLFGDKSIEFFYNAGNPSGSPLAPRQDVVYTNVGCLRPEMLPAQSEYYFAKQVAQLEETLYFLGVAEGGGIGLYKIENFRLHKLSDARLDEELTYVFSSSDATVGTEAVPLLGAFYVGGKRYIQITSGYDINRYSILYDLETGAVCDIESNDPDFTGANLYELSVCWGFIDTQHAHSGTGTDPRDGSTIAFTASGYHVNLLPHVHKDGDNSSMSSAYDIDMEIITPTVDFDIPQDKFYHSLEIQGYYASDETVSISWSDDDYQTFSTARSVDVSDRTKLTRLGKSSRRAFKLQYGSQEYYAVKNLQLNFSVGSV